MREKTGQFGFTFSGPRKYQAQPSLRGKGPTGRPHERQERRGRGVRPDERHGVRQGLRGAGAPSTSSPVSVPGRIQRCRGHGVGRMFRYRPDPRANNPDQPSMTSPSWRSLADPGPSTAWRSTVRKCHLPRRLVVSRRADCPDLGPQDLANHLCRGAFRHRARRLRAQYVNCDQFVIDVEDFERRPRSPGPRSPSCPT